MNSEHEAERTDSEVLAPPPPILIEWPNEPGGIQKASRGQQLEKLAAHSEEALAAAMTTIQSMSCRVARMVGDLNWHERPDAFEVQFGINLDLELGAVVAKTTAGAQLEIRLAWNHEEPDRIDVQVKE